MPNTPLRMTSGRFNAFEVTPYSLYALLPAAHARERHEARPAYRTSGNDPAGWKQKVQTVREAGLDPILN